MNIKGEKIVLRALSLRDKELLLKLMNDPETEMFLGGSSFPVSIEEQEQWIEAQIGRKDTLRCIVELSSNLEAIGTVAITDIDMKNGLGQVHIKLDKELGRGKGYGTDALRTIVNYAFNELRLNCIYADVLESNHPSQKLLEKCGFRKEGLLRSRVYKNGRYIDVVSYSYLTKDRGC
ncbi:GNAT family N-acetyltransferase [Streptococcus suis]|nr:GNAT family N-acetyltransferase [Streptococcus suis]